MVFGLRQLIVMAVLLAVPLASYFLVFRPQNVEITRAKAEVEMKLKTLDKLREETSRSEDLVQANEKMKEAIGGVESRLPPDKEADTVLRDVANIAGKNGLRIPKFVRSNNKIPAGIAQEQQLEIEIVGDFDGFYQFLLDLEKLPRITRLPDFKILRSEEHDKNPDAQAKDGLMKANLTLSIYFQGELAGATHE